MSRTRPQRWPLNPPHPERVCWGCEKLCPAHDLACGNGSDRTQHPSELFGPDWYVSDAATDEAQETVSRLQQDNPP